MTNSAPLDDSISIPDMIRDPYITYKRLRNSTPVVQVPALSRTLLTKAEHTKFVKSSPELFSADDPNTPMKRAFQAHTLMRKDGDEHLSERNAMAPAFSPRNIRGHWTAVYEDIGREYVARLPRGETVDLFTDLAAPYSARVLAHFLGLESATDAEMCHWSQSLIDGAGNFGWADEPFRIVDAAHEAMNSTIAKEAERHKLEQGPSALSAMINAESPIAYSQILSNLKIAIGGGINEPRDAFLTVLFGLLTNQDHIAAVKDEPKWFVEAFEEGVRWIAPIQVSSRKLKEDVEIGGCLIPKGDVVMTSQASAGRDEDVHENGEVFDLFRAKKSHQSFGVGPHFCQGTHIARMMVANILLPMMFDRFPNMELRTKDDVVWSGFGFRGPLNLPVYLD